MRKGFPALFSLVAFFAVCAHVHAASLYMDPNAASLNRGDTITIAVRLDTGEGECVNAIDGVIKYSDNIEPVDISRGNSIFSIWVEDPVINKTDHTITFAGGIPNGYCGRIAGDPLLTNDVVDLQFQSPGLQIGTPSGGDQATIEFDPSTHVYLNDGLGTIASTSFSGATIDLAKQAGGSVKNPWNDVVTADKTPPEKFAIDLERSKNAFSNKYFIVFNTTDKQSGLDHYEVMEQPLASKNLFGWGAENAPWVTAKSPYVLDDQSLNSTIRVKAIDKAGNETISTLVPDESERTVSTDNIIIISSLVGGLVILLLAVGVFIYFLRKRRSRVEQSRKEEDTDDVQEDEDNDDYDEEDLEI